MREQNSFEKIYAVIRQIPKGQVASYGQIAELAGNRRWARVVGYALHVVPQGSTLPCHRVVTKEGKLSDAFGSGPDNRQAQLLRQEGVECVDGYVDMKKYQWKKRLF